MFRFVASIKIINANRVFFVQSLTNYVSFILFVEFWELKPLKILKYLVNVRGNDLLKQRLLQSTPLHLKCIMICLYSVIEFTSLLVPD